MTKFVAWIKGFYPQPISVNFQERSRACTGALLGIIITSVVTHHFTGSSGAFPFLMAPIGASAVLLFAVPASPLAQPWSIVGGNTIAAVIGVTFALFIKDVAIAAALALSVSIAFMFALRCIHPPSGAVALSAVLGGSSIQALGYGFVIYPVLINSILLLMVALIYNNATRRVYPHPVLQGSESSKNIPAEMRFGFTSEDLNEVLKEYNQIIDVSRDDLQVLLQQTEMHAYRRRFGEITCKEIMSKHVVSVEFGTELEEAWALLRKHKIKALPVVDRAQRVIGIVTQVDFIKHANLDLHEGFEHKLKDFIKRTAGVYSDKPEVIGQIMTSPVVTANVDMHIIELIPLMSQNNQLHHHIPVIDANRKLVGIVTQSDLVSALYHGRIANLRTLGLSY
ncbi:MAG: HPP family protein [Pseudomonadota bacterium]